MDVLAVIFVLGLTAGSCVALSHGVDIIDNVKKMVLEYRSSMRDSDSKHAGKIEAVPYDSLTVRQFQESVLRADEGEATDSIPGVAGKLGLTELVDLMIKASLKHALESAGPFTLFGPTNDAFSSLPNWVKKQISNATVLADVLKFHVLSGKVSSKSLSNEVQVATVEGRKLRINLYSKHRKAVATAQCAPIDLGRVDQMASNGILHVLNAVMIPPAGTIVSTLAACPVFKTLVEAVKVAGLVDTLSSPGPFTLFAPTDKAFDKLPPGTLEKLLKHPTELANILKYHLVSGTFCTAGLSAGKVKTMEGHEVAVSVSSDDVVVNESKVIFADGSVTNGVVHAIDTVLLPPDFCLP